MPLNSCHARLVNPSSPPQNSRHTTFKKAVKRMLQTFRGACVLAGGLGWTEGQNQYPLWSSLSALLCPHHCVIHGGNFDVAKLSHAPALHSDLRNASTMFHANGHHVIACGEGGGVPEYAARKRLCRNGKNDGSACDYPPGPATAWGRPRSAARAARPPCGCPSPGTAPPWGRSACGSGGPGSRAEQPAPRTQTPAQNHPSHVFALSLRCFQPFQ